MFAAIIGILGPILGQVAKSIFPDPADKLKAQQLEQELQLAIINKANEIERAGADIVKTEAQSEHFLTATWRPLMMLTFGALIVARWLGYSAPGISEAEVLKLWDIINLGIGGYVIGRSVEKVAPALADIVRKK